MRVKLFFPILLWILITSCEKPDKVTWGSHIKAPIAFATLDIKNLIVDSGATVSEDNAVAIQLEQTVYQLKPLDNLVAIDIPPFIRKITIDELALDNVSIEQKTTLETLIGPEIGAIITDGYVLDPLFLSLFGFDDVAPAPFYLDISEYFERAVLEKGTINIGIENKLPFDIEDLNFSILNYTDGTVIYTKNIPSIPNGTTFEEVGFDLATELDKKEIEGQIRIITNSMKIVAPEGVNPILIDYNDYIKFSFNLKDLTVESATAIFPAQTLTDYANEIDVEVENDVELKSAEILSGKLNIRVRSTIPTEIFLDYQIPSATLEGAPFRLNESIRASENGVPTVINESFPVNNYEFDFSGLNRLEVNKFYNSVQLSIEEASKAIRITKLDTIYIEITVTDLIPKKVNGYVGKKIYNVGPSNERFNILPNYLNAINFETANLNLTLNNTTNVEASCSIVQLDAVNTETNKRVPANISNNDFLLPSESQARVAITNATPMLDIAPNQIDYALTLQLNPEGNTPPYSNVITSKDSITAAIDLMIPLRVKIEDLKFQDTLELADDLNLKDQELRETVLSIVAKNSFPIAADLKIYFADENKNIVEVIKTSRPIDAGTLTNGRVMESTISLFEFDLTQTQIETLLESSFIFLEANMNTTHPDFVTLYSDYIMDISLVLESKVNIDAAL